MEAASFGTTTVRAPLHGVELATERLALRPLTMGHAGALARHLGDIEVSRWLARVPHPYAPSDARAFVDHVRAAAAAGSAVTLSISPLDAKGDLLGVVALHGLETAPELGYWLARPYWGQGIMTEAVWAMLAHVYETLRVDVIHSGAFKGNDASLAIQRRMGFATVGISRRPCLARGTVAEHVDTKLSRAEFAAAQGARRCANPRSGS
jgi:RimJ/RimL family protein N-acetyltransferase